MASIDTASRELLVGYYLENQSTVALAKAHGISQPTVSRRLRQATDRLREKLCGHGITVTAVVLMGLLKENVVQAAPPLVMRELGKMALAGSSAVGATSTSAATQASRSLLLRLFNRARLKVVSALVLCTSTLVYVTHQWEGGKKGGAVPTTPIIRVNSYSPENTLITLERFLTNGNRQGLQACFARSPNLTSQITFLQRLGPPLSVLKREEVDGRVRIFGALRVMQPFQRTKGAEIIRWEAGDPYEFYTELEHIAGQWKIVHIE